MFAGLAGGWLGAPHCTRRQRMQTRLALRVVLCCSQVQCDPASSQKDVKRGSVHVMFAGLAGGVAGGPALHTSPTHANALGFACCFVLQPSDSVILHHSKGRQERKRARHVCGVGGRVARAPALHTSPTHANALGFARRFAAAVQCDPASLKGREERKRARHVCGVGGRVGRGPALHTSPTHTNAWFCASFCEAAVNNVILHLYETT